MPLQSHSYPTHGYDPNADPALLVSKDAVTWIQTHGRFTKGTLAGQPISLFPWQKKIVRDLLGTKYGKRRHRRGLVGMPRKNGKSLLGAGLALYALIGEGEQGAEVYGIAGARDQARIVFGEAKRMVEMNPALKAVVKIYRSELVVPSTGSVYRVLAAESYTAEGLNPSFVIADEVHVLPQELWDTMTLGSAARDNALVVGITTAGHDKDTLCGRLYDYGKRVQSGEVDDPSFYFHWLEPKNPSADWKDPKAWRECNPGLRSGFLQMGDFETAVKQTSESAFRRYRLNQWTTTAEAWLPAGAWDSCFSPTQIPAGSEVVLGFDGSWASDSTALVMCTPAGHLQVIKSWEKPAHDESWRVPIEEVEQTILAACQGFKVREVACDPYRWQRSMQVLEAKGVPIVEWPTNSVPRMVPATQKFYDAVVGGKLSHDGDPRLARHIANCVVKTDRNGRRITKDHKTRKIDLAVAAVIAYDRASQAKPQRAPVFVI